MKDNNIKSHTNTRLKADRDNINHVGATMPGIVLKTLVTQGSKINKGDPILVTESMKMETTIQAPYDGILKNLHVSSGDLIDPWDFLVELEKELQST